MKIGVIHLNQIGDLVFSLPLLKSLRDSYPAAEIHSVIKPGIATLLKGSPFVDRFIPKPGHARETFQLMRALRRNAYDLLITLARSEEAFLLTAWSGAGRKAGFRRFPWDLVLDVKETVVGHNSPFNNAKLLRSLGIPVTAQTYVGLLPVSPDECPVSIPGPYVVISAGASPRRLIKAWDEEKFAELIVELKARHGLTPVLVGAGDTVESNGMITALVKADAKGKDIEVRDLTGTLNLRALTALLMRARLFVGIDSGVMHLASASDVPVVALFGPTDPFYVGPQNTRSAVVSHSLDCMPCYLKKTCDDVRCMRELSPGKVIEACTRLLDAEAGVS
jgi:ADP-heptose:LPS heptosyltransferase